MQSKLTPRQGVTIIEMTISLILMLAVLGVVTQAVVGVSRQRRVVVQRMLATQEVANITERANALSWDRLTPENVAAWSVAKELARRLPNAVLQIDVDELNDPLVAKRVTVQLVWTNHAGRQVAPVRLVSWVYQPEASE